LYEYENIYDVTPEGFGTDFKLNPPPVNRAWSLKAKQKNLF